MKAILSTAAVTQHVQKSVEKNVQDFASRYASVVVAALSALQDHLERVQNASRKKIVLKLVIFQIDVLVKRKQNIQMIIFRKNITKSNFPMLFQNLGRKQVSLVDKPSKKIVDYAMMVCIALL